VTIRSARGRDGRAALRAGLATAWLLAGPWLFAGATPAPPRPADPAAPAQGRAAEHPGAFRVVPPRPLDELRREARAASPPPERGPFRSADLVPIDSLDPGIRLDIRYATSDNFLGAPVYGAARALLQRPVAEALARAHRALRAHGYGLLVYDAYRPWWVTKLFWAAVPEDKHAFVANPATGSRHNRGCAVDLTLYTLADGRAVEMPSSYDEMSERASPRYGGGSAAQRARRDRLRRAMEAQGFTVFATEWWHFDHRSWREYRLLNLPLDLPATSRSAP
jgi:zinc D-Ala-D-Ala dipeptidase